METVRVRVFVSVSPSSDWMACGGRDISDTSAKSVAIHRPDDGDIGYWIEADLPLPNQSPEIVATVTRAEWF